MKKSILAITLLTAMMAMPMSMNAETMMDVPTCEQPSNDRELATQAEVDEFVHDLKYWSGIDEFKMNKARRFFENHMMDVEGIYRAAKTFNFDEGRLEFLKLAYEHCVDYEYFDKVYETFKWSTCRDQLKDFVKNY